MIRNIRNIFFPLFSFILMAIYFSGCTPSGPKALLQGEELLSQGRPDEAVKKLERAVKYMQGNEKAWLFLGIAYHQNKQYQKAIQAYQRANTLSPSMNILRYNLGCLYMDMKNYTLAIHSLSNYLNFESNSGKAWEKIGAKVCVVGSLATGLLAKRRDIDLHAYTSLLDAKNGFSAMAEIAKGGNIKSCSFLDLSSTREECME